MPYTLFKIIRTSILSCLCLLSFGGIASGLILTVTKSPAQKAQHLSEQATYNATQSDFSQAQINALYALSYTPYDPTLWTQLDFIKQQQAKPVHTAQRYKFFTTLDTHHP
jgi:hypothetical protein